MVIIECGVGGIARAGAVGADQFAFPRIDACRITCQSSLRGRSGRRCGSGAIERPITLELASRVFEELGGG